MRILLLGPTCRFGRGGIETQIQELESAFEQLGHRCEAIDTFHQPWSGRMIQQLAQALSRCNVVLMMGLNLKALALCLLFRRPVLLSHHIVTGGTGRRRLLHRWVAKHLPSLYNSAFLASLEHRGQLPPQVVHPCFSSSAYPPLAQQAEDWLERPYDVGFVGRLLPEKGGELLLEACSSLQRSGLSVLVIGEGPSRSNLEALAVAKRLSVHFTRGLDFTAVADLLLQLKVLVVPSLCQETFGVVVLEGLAAGCHVVASAIGGLPEAGDAHAHYVKPGDDQALSLAIAALLDGPPPQRLEARQHHLQRFDPLTVARRIEAPLQQLLQ